MDTRACIGVLLPAGVSMSSKNPCDASDVSVLQLPNNSTKN